MPKDRLSSVMEREAALIPDTLTSQFQDRVTRQEAVNTWEKRQSATTALFPSGNLNYFEWSFNLKNSHILKKVDVHLSQMQ